MALPPSLLLALLALPGASASAPLIIDEKETVRREAPPHGAIGMSTAYRITDGVPRRTMEFRRRILDPGAAIGLHPIAHDEVYYVLDGTGVVHSGATERRIGRGMTAYLYSGETVGIRQTGPTPLSLIIAYPLPAR